MKQTNKTMQRVVGVAAAMTLATFGVAACSSDDDDSSTTTSVETSVVEESDAAGDSDEASDAATEEGTTVTLEAADGSSVELTGSIAEKYEAATEEQKADLGAPLTGEDASGTSDSGVVFQQFDGGVITAANGEVGTPAYITWGVIRDAWNVLRDDSGQPAEDGEGGSDGPLGAATSDETETDGVKESTFENGTITFDPATETVEVTIDGEVVPTE